MSTAINDIEIRRATQRGKTRIGWLNSAHSFSFGQYYDPARMGYRSLRVINDDWIEPATGFGEHGHDNMEIISWAIQGGLQHGDSLENSYVLKPGEAQVMSAGTGIHHSEFNASKTDKAHFLQVWIQPSEMQIAPRYGQKPIDPAKRHNAFAPIASGNDAHVQDGALPIHQDAAVFIADLDPGASASHSLGQGRGAYVHIVTGTVELAGHTLGAGDAAIIETPGETQVTAAAGKDAAQVMLFDLA